MDVERASQPREGVEEEDDVPVGLGFPAGVLEDELREADVVSPLAKTSPLIERRMSVTSSGRSSISRTRRSMSAFCLLMAKASCCMSIVFPALGGETIRARCPLPMGQKRSTTRMARSLPFPSRRRDSLGETTSWAENSRTRDQAAGVIPLTVVMAVSSGLFPLRSSAVPWIRTPSRRLYFVIREPETYGLEASRTMPWLIGRTKPNRFGSISRIPETGVDMRGRGYNVRAARPPQRGASAFRV